MSDQENFTQEDFEKPIDTEAPSEQQQQQQQQVPDPAASIGSGDADLLSLSSDLPPNPAAPDGDGKGEARPMLLYFSCFARVDPRARDLILWRDPKRSGSSLACLLILLWAAASLSLISVLAYAGLAALLCSTALKLYAYTMKRPGSQQQDFLSCLQGPITLPKACIVRAVEEQLGRAETELNLLLDLLMFRDSIRTLKFFLGLILLTYIGSWFNTITLLTLCGITAFTLPKAYSVYHVQADAAIAKLIDHYRQVNRTIRNAIPFGKDKKN